MKRQFAGITRALVKRILEKMRRVNKGRLIYPIPDKLTQYVLKEYLDRKNKIIQI